MNSIEKACAVEWPVKCPVSHWSAMVHTAGCWLENRHVPWFRANSVSSTKLHEEEEEEAQNHDDKNWNLPGNEMTHTGPFIQYVTFCFQIIQIQLRQFTAGTVVYVKWVLSEHLWTDLHSLLCDLASLPTANSRHCSQIVKEDDCGHLLAPLVWN